MDTSKSGTNNPELSVSELSSALKRTVEDAFGHVRVRGEISGYRGPHSSGHVYFSLKDASARIDAIIWKGVFSRLGMKPEDGLEVIATGKLSTFAGKSSYQIIIEAMEPAGVGALLAQLEERKKRLAAEGLFALERKRALPFLPRVIGVVTSPTGAVIRDILHRLEDRFPCHVIVWPVRVQGETSAEEVAKAIAGFNALSEGGAIPRPDVLIVARGGGSLEDLWSFNEEIVVRAAAASAIVLISAVGHETDTTLIDFAADRRAPTPTGAAEMAVPVRADLVAQIRSLASRLSNAMRRMMEQRRSGFKALERASPSPESLLAFPRQKLDNLGQRLGPALKAATHAKRLALVNMSNRLAGQAPTHKLARLNDILIHKGERLTRAQSAVFKLSHHRLDHAGLRLTLRPIMIRLERNAEQLNQLDVRRSRAMQNRLQNFSRHLSATAQLFEAFSYQGVLKRGFALVLDDGGKPVRSAAQTSAGDHLNITMADGIVGVTVNGDAPVSSSRVKTAKATNGGPTQGNLF
jgi:exodeoxyribonuclease VII large subunit